MSLLAGCGSGGGGDGHAAATLGPEGGVVRSVAGVGVSVPAGVLDAAIGIDVAETERPLPLPEGWEALGPAFRIAADREAPSDGDVTGFVIGLPVPDGADTARLGAAAFVAEGGALDAPGAFWTTVRGQWSEAEGMLLVRAPSLGTEARVLQLFTADWVDSPTAPTPDPGSGRSRRISLVTDIDWAAGFVVEPEGSPPPSPEWIAFHESVLADALERYRDAELVPFALEYAGLDLWLDPPTIGFLGDPRFLVNLRRYQTTSLPADEPCEIGPDGILSGAYDPTWETLTLCAAVAGPDDEALAADARDTAFHELFHAEQKRFFSTPMLQDHRWFAEGTATLAESLQSSETPRRDESRDRRSVAVPLASDDRASTYETQDFWAFVARENGLDLEDLVEPFFLAGDLTPAAIAAVFDDPAFDTPLDSTYGRWVVDQVADTARCTVDEDLVGAITDLDEVLLEEGADSDYPEPVAVTLAPLTTGVYRVDVASVRTTPTRLRIELSGVLAGVERSVTVLRTDVGGGCATVVGLPAGDLRAATLEIAPGDQATLTVLVANGDAEVEGAGTLTIEDAPRVSVEHVRLDVEAEADVDEGQDDELDLRDEPTGSAAMSAIGVWESRGATENSAGSIAWNESFDPETGSVTGLFVQLQGQADVALAPPDALGSSGRAAVWADVAFSFVVVEPVDVTITGSASGTGIRTEVELIGVSRLYSVDETLPEVPIAYTATLPPGFYYLEIKPEIEVELELDGAGSVTGSADGTFELTMTLE